MTAAFKTNTFRDKHNAGAPVTLPTVAPLFPLGPIKATHEALRVIQDSGQEAVDFVARHAAGDWGEEDGEGNATNLRIGVIWLKSRYRTSKGAEILVLTMGTPTYTTVLLPGEY